MKKICVPAFVVLAVMLSFTSCQKDPVDYSAYYAALAAAKASGGTTGTGTTGTGTTGTGTTGTGTTGTTGAGGTTASASDYYVKGTMNGVAFSWQVNSTASGFATGGLSALQSDQGTETGSISALISQNGTFQPNLGFQFETVSVSTVDNNTAYFEGFVNPGSLPFASSTANSIVKTLTINYTDAANNLYSSVGVQTGTVTIVSVTKIAAQTGTAESLKIKLTFNCILYPILGTTGGSISLTNVEATVNLQNLL